MMMPMDIANEFAEERGEVGIETNYDGHKYPPRKDWHWVDGHSCEVECGELLWGLVRYLKPEIIVETGTYRGFAASCMALACRENARGHVWTIDYNEGQAQRACEHITKVGLQTWCSVVVGSALSDELTNLLPGPIDLCLIDAGDRIAELEKHEKLMSPTGVLLMHDALKIKGAYEYSKTRGMGFLWGLRGLSMLLPKE